MSIKIHILSPLACATLLLASSAFAATAEKAPAKPSSSTVTEAVSESDVVGSKEAPGIFNVVPWKEKNVQLQKNEVSTSILRETLQPLDRDVLRREIEFHRSSDQN
ncbi:MAG: hypothetical protein IT466_05220 [Moraxellaceae bacterium]|nr:hypothetical protein [Moraxellaceae bacterium]MBP8852285.1 hypothetical protein [Moraxellaceae bacterium]MBP9045264.1 hypothetical protein [Moraxellaceae bacterium]MBP9730394.1 hypothetical protein [Moraxellaceae bacterium]MCC6200158.1 hypothetical protein [Moraxellaceae bacterium]